ncbi:hypothetical protein GCM10027034_34270 [Ramlibacter solisilvae]|uniref:Lipoprotein n=1 Tax=Ramlibacter tataouinensis TaxID=94132 RepID=A0A127JSK2_9BURK|nr:hypothetical protein [Ramlibacter tataouinensis]AMO22920.1 hypothetical protein UC35_08500 [Ramlibacter tataouinensis]
MSWRPAALALLLALAACGSQPPAPGWQGSAHDSLGRFTTAYLKGDSRADSEFQRARGELASTGQAGLVARAELTRCAAMVASLVQEPCEGFERLRADAPAPERAYADYLAGRVAPTQVALLPPQYRAVAGGREDAAALQAIGDPLSRLVAAGVLFRNGRASPQVLTLASDTASQQGWRRPLLAWLGVQAQRAERAGARDEAERIRRRMQLAGEGR